MLLKWDIGNDNSSHPHVADIASC